jgi:DNA repair exonuclease SbcCD ATPase subunit
VSFDDQIRTALDNATTSLREHLEAELHAFAQEVVRVSMEERQHAVAAASQAAAAEVRAQAEVLVADVRSQAEAQVWQFRAAAHTHAEGLKRAAEGQIGELRKGLEELRAQAQQQLDAVRRTAHDEIERVRAEVETAHAEIKNAHGELENAHGELENARGELENARGELEKAHGELEKANGELEKAHGELERANGELEKAHGELEKAHGETEWANAEIHKAKAEAEHARHEIDAARAETEDVRNQARSEIARAQVEADKARKSAVAEVEEALTARLTAAQALSEQKASEAIERAHTDSHQSEVARAARLADAIRNLDEARGLSEVLERLVQSAGYEVDRAAMLLVKGDRLTGWRLAGFAPGGPSAKSIDLSIGEAGLAGAVLESRVSVSRPSDATHGPALPPFAADASEGHAMALPIRVGGEVVAVLYADAARPDAPSSDARWPAVLEILVRHASRVLEAMTVQQAAGLSLAKPKRTFAGGDRTLLGGAQ